LPAAPPEHAKKPCYPLENQTNFVGMRLAGR